jgi:hypothetical protein
LKVNIYYEKLRKEKEGMKNRLDIAATVDASFNHHNTYNYLLWGEEKKGSDKA